MINKIFWTVLGTIILVWQLISPNLSRTLIGITFFIVGCMQEKK